MSEDEPARSGPPRAWAWAAPALVALVALLPFAGGILAGRSLYFRDLALQFFPLRLFALEGLRHGELRFWNPYVHEGEPNSLPPISYPLDLLQALLPTEAGLSASLALHVPLGALAFFALARGLGLRRGAAAGGALVYALGGFNLSTLNLYVYVQAAAWAPLVLLGLHRAARGRAGIAPAALASALAVSTTGAEIVAQAFVLGLVVAAPGRSPRAWLRSLGAIALGLGIAAPTIAMMAGLVASSARQGGFPAQVTLSHSIHPLTFAQVVIAGFHGDPGDIVNRWWGSNFFPRGFPYFVSLYLGSASLALAVVGLRFGGPLARRVAALGLLAGVVCLGRWAGLEPLVELLPVLRIFRFPSKAFFTLHAAVAVLVALGLDRLRSRPRAWRWLLGACLLAGSFLVALPLAPRLAPAAARWFAAGFFPPHYPWSERARLLAEVLSDAACGGAVAIAVGALAWAVVKGRLGEGRAALLAIALVAADLLRAGSGLNPTLPPQLFLPSPEVASVARALRDAGGRIYVPDILDSPAYLEGRASHPSDHRLWSFVALVDSLTPLRNLALSLPSALSIDLTMLVPTDRVLAPELARPEKVPALVPLLRNAGVAHVLSLDVLEEGELRLRGVLAPARIAPLHLRVYALQAPLPLRSVARDVVPAASRAEAVALSSREGFQEAGGVVVEGLAAPAQGVEGRILSLVERPDRIEAEVVSDRPSVLFLRDPFAVGWSASVGDRPAPVLRANGRHRAVPVPAGRSRVTLSYLPPHLAWGLGLSAVSAALAALLRRSSPASAWRGGEAGGPTTS